MTTPYVPQVPLQGMRGLFNATAQVSRLTAVVAAGAVSTTWAVPQVNMDPYLDTLGQFRCRLDLQFVRPGKDQPQPIVAGRAPDRVGVLFYSPVTDVDGVPLVLAGDRITMVSGPVNGTFEIRIVPDVAQDYLGAHHVEVQVIEVSQALKPGSVTPFPGSPI